MLNGDFVVVVAVVFAVVVLFHAMIAIAHTISYILFPYLQSQKPIIIESGWATDSCLIRFIFDFSLPHSKCKSPHFFFSVDNEQKSKAYVNLNLSAATKHRTHQAHPIQSNPQCKPIRKPFTYELFITLTCSQIHGTKCAILSLVCVASINVSAVSVVDEMSLSNQKNQVMRESKVTLTCCCLMSFCMG